DAAANESSRRRGLAWCGLSPGPSPVTRTLLPMPRSLWNGTIAFGMVRVPVKLYSATEAKAIRFRERHVTDAAPVEHRRVCAKEDKEVPYAEIVKGFEVSPGSYVVLTKEEIAAA